MATHNRLPTMLSRAFGKYGLLIGRHPLPFLLAPIALWVMLLPGLIRLHVISDLEQLHSPQNAPSKRERDYFEDTFPNEENGNFSAFRRLRNEGFFFKVLVENRGSDKNMMNNKTINAVLALDEFTFQCLFSSCFIKN